MKALIIYWSATGNTKSVAETIHNTLQAGDEDWYEYDLLFIGSQPYSSGLPPEPVQKYLKEKRSQYKKQGRIK